MNSMTEQERKDLIGELFQKKLDTCDDGHECDMYLFDLEEMSENVVSSFQLPLSVVPNLKVNGKEYIVPMVTEESSVVASCAKALNTLNKYGFYSHVLLKTYSYGTIYLRAASDELKELFWVFFPQMKELCKDSHGRKITGYSITQANEYIRVLIQFSVGETMGANYINKSLEKIATFIKEKIECEIIACILTNETDYKVVSKISFDCSEVNNNFLVLADIAKVDEYRMVTHNKGILNGIEAVCLALGQDTRALFYGLKRQCLTTYVKNGDKIDATITLNLNIGVVGGAIDYHPQAKKNYEMLGCPNKKELAGILASIGLAQNFSEIKAITEEGICLGHLKLHNQKKGG